MSYLVPFRRGEGSSLFWQFAAVEEKAPDPVIYLLQRIREACRGTLAEKILAKRIYERVHVKVNRSFWRSWSYSIQARYNPFSSAYQIERIYGLIIKEPLVNPGQYTIPETREVFCRAVNPKLLEITTNELKFARRKSCNAIANQIFLGSATGFVETTNLPCFAKGKKLVTNNPHGFQIIITVCPTVNALKGFVADPMQTRPLIKTFEERQILWLRVAENVRDLPADWTSLVFNCTFPDDELSWVQPKTTPEFAPLLKQKWEVLLQVPVDQWFEPTFRILDRGFFQGQKTLIHCQAGISRSPSVLAAYFIKRLNASVGQVLNHLRNQRVCIDTYFEAGLVVYAHQLSRRPLLPESQ